MLRIGIVVIGVIALLAIAATAYFLMREPPAR